MPELSATSSLTPTSQALLDGVLGGDIRSIAKVMSLAESTTRNDGIQALFSIIYANAGSAHTIGLTGVPGSGKSTMVRAMAQQFRAAGRTVGIIAIDPSSPFSGGAILGDRVRMGELAGDDGVFIRSMATRGSMGGLTRGCMETVDILDAAGFDIILIETVGVGQDEVDIARSALSVVVISAPGLGDDIQAIKAGVLEIADMHVVSKCDRPDASKTVADLKGMVGMGLSGRNRLGWNVPVIPTSAEKGEGIGDLIAALGAHREHLKNTDEGAVRAREIAHMRVTRAAEDIARERVATARGEALDNAMTRISSRDMDPCRAARILMNESWIMMPPDEVFYVVRSWVDPEHGQSYVDWLENKHMAEVLAEPGVRWARKAMLDQTDENGWQSCLLLYGFENRAALEAYMKSDARSRFWAQLEEMKDIHYSDRFWGEVDFSLDKQGRAEC